MSGAMLRTEALSVGYGDVTVVRDVSFTAEAGSLLALIGPNGAGKSTLLKTLIGQLPPVAGTVYLMDRDMAGLSEREIARTMSAVLTGRPRPELMTCGDVVASGRYPYTGRLGILSDADKAVVRETMELVRVWELYDRDFDRISDGQRQRVMLARAICQEPKVLILDEPTSFLDVKHKLDFLTLLRALARERSVAVVLSLHELELARRFSDRLLCIRDGAVDHCGTPEEIFRDDYIDALYDMAPGSYRALYDTHSR